MKKKLIIISGVIVGVVGVILILLYTLFALKSVSVDYRSSLNNLTATQEEIVKSGEFKYGSPTLFQSKNKYIERIEKSNPYIEVINIETKFPNKFIIHARERQEVFAFNFEGDYYVCDFNLKVLKITDGEFLSTSSNPILIENPNFLTQPKLGEKVEIKDFADFYSAFVKNNLLLHEQIDMFKTVEFGTFHDENVNKDQSFLKLTTFSGQAYLIKNSQYLLDLKAAKAYYIFSNIYSLIGQKINADSDELWTKEKLNSATIEINNYYRKDEVYSKIIPAENV